MASGRPRSLVFRALALLMSCTIAGGAVAQQPYFRYATPGGATSPGTPPVVVPPGEDHDPGETEQPKMGFGDGKVAPFTVRALVGEPFSLEFGTIGGTDPINWLAPPALPVGVEYADGILYGIPSAPHSGTADFEAVDARGESARGRVTFTFVNAAVSLSRFKPVVRIGDAYSGEMSSNVRDASYQVSGAPGVALLQSGNPGGGELAGTAAQAGTFPLLVTVGRAGTAISATASRQVTVAPPLAIEFDPPSIPAIAGPVSVTATPRNVVGTPTMGPTMSQNALSARGLAYANGRLSGTLRPGAATSLSLRLVDSADGESVTVSFQVPAIATQPATIVWNGEVRPGAPLTASPGNPAPATIATEIPSPICTVTRPIPGVTVSPDCAISGAPTGPGRYELEVSIVPSGEPSAPPIVVSAPLVVHPSLVVASPNPNPRPAVGAPVEIVPDSSGVICGPTYALTGATEAQLLEAGLAFDAASGSVSGIPYPGTSVSFGIEATDCHDGAKASQVFTVVVAQASIASDVVTANLRSGDVRTFTATTNISNATFSLVGAPDYVSIDPQIGTVTYIAPDVQEPTAIPAYAIRASHPTRPEIARQVSIPSPGTLRPALTLTIAETASVRGHVALDIPLQKSGGNPTVAPTVASGSLPTGMLIEASRVYGKPTVPGTYPLTLRYRDSADGRSVEAPITIEVTPSLGFRLSSTGATLGRGVVDQPFSVTATTDNVLGSIRFDNVQVSGAPALLSSAGLRIDPATGAITGINPDGSPTTVFVGRANIRMTETHLGVATEIDRTIDLSISAPQNASGMYPSAALEGTDITPLIYDASLTTSIPFASGQTVRFTFDSPVSVNGINVNSTSNRYFRVTNVTTGVSQRVYASNGTLALTQSASDAWDVTYDDSGSMTLRTLRLTFNGDAPYAPGFTAPSVSSFYTRGNALSIAPSGVTNVQSPGTWSLAGDLPPGLSLNEATGALTGTPTEVGDYAVSLSVVDGRGIRSYAAPFAVRVFPSTTAATKVPVVTGSATASDTGETVSGPELLARIYDDSSSTSIRLGAGQVLTYTFDEPVVVDGLQTYTSGRFLIRNETTGQVLYNTTGSPNSFPASHGTVFSVTNAGTSEMSQWHLALRYGGNRPSLPSSTFGSASSNYLLGDAVALSMSASDVSPANSGTWTLVGRLPNGVSQNASTGRISGNANEIGTFPIFSYVTDGRGYRSSMRSHTLTVLPSATAANTVARVSPVDGLDADEASARLMDASATTALTLEAGATLTYDFGQPTVVNGFYFQVSGTARTVSVRDEAGEEVYAGTSATGYRNFTSGATSPNGMRATVGTRLTVTNTSGQPLVLVRASPHYGGSNAAATTYPAVTANASYAVSRMGTASLSPLAAAQTLGAQSWTLSGSLPDRFEFNPSTGAITRPGTSNLSVPESRTVTLSVTDGRGIRSALATLTINVD